MTDEPDPPPVVWEPCPECDGEGRKERCDDGYKVYWEDCYMCNGTGKTEVEE